MSKKRSPGEGSGSSAEAAPLLGREQLVAVLARCAGGELERGLVAERLERRGAHVRDGRARRACRRAPRAS